MLGFKAGSIAKRSLSKDDETLSDFSKPIQLDPLSDLKSTSNVIASCNSSEPIKYLMDYGFGYVTKYIDVMISSIHTHVLLPSLLTQSYVTK